MQPECNGILTVLYENPAAFLVRGTWISFEDPNHSVHRAYEELPEEEKETSVSQADLCFRTLLENNTEAKVRAEALDGL